jgi:hypothetical protein
MPTEVPQAAPALADANREARWRTCLHEAGHAVAGQILLGGTTRAVVLRDHCGAAYLGGDERAPVSFERVLAVAVGAAAELLAARHAPPEAVPGPALEVAYPEPVAALREEVWESPADATTIARWCIAGVEERPERSVGRFHWIHREARLFVARHRREITQSAAGLYARGIITLPAEPA